jgi:uncharacterized protein
MRVSHYRSRFGNDAFGLTIIPTLACNFGCDYCYQKDEIHQPQQSITARMSAETQEAILNLVKSRVKEKGNFTVTWYGGEPLLCTDVLSSLTEGFKSICDERKARYHCGMITNGYLLDQDALGLLSDLEIKFCQITLDGPQEVHDQRRPLRSGKGTYDRILQNVRGILDCSDVSISLRVNVDQRNKDSIPELLDDLRDRGMHQEKNLSVYFAQVLHYLGSCNDVAQFCMVTEQFAEYQLHACHLAMDKGFHVTAYPSAIIGSCGAVSANSMVIEPDATIQNCWNAVGNTKCKTGKLTEEGPQLNGNYYRWLAWSPFRDECVACKVLPLCMGGCPYKTLYTEDLTEAQSNICAWWKYNLGQMLELYHEASRRGLLARRNVESATAPEQAQVGKEGQSGE